MQRGVLVLTIGLAVVLVIAVSVLATHIETSTPIPRKISPFEEEYYPTPPRPSAPKGLPDLIVTRIIIPDELPLYAIVESFEVEIANVGESVAHGEMDVYVELRAPNIPRCALRIPAGEYSRGRVSPNVYLMPGEKMVVKIADIPYGTGAGALPWSCRRPIAGDLTIIAEVNPAMGGQVGPVYRGSILESEQKNNRMEKTVRVREELGYWSIPVKLVKGLNAFSVPVVTKMLAKQFSETTGCELFKLPHENLKASLGLRTIDIEELRPVSPVEELKAGEVYFAQCLKDSKLSFEGLDPGPLNIELPGKGLMLVGSRAGMQGRRIYELVQGCGNPWALTRYMSFVPGERTAIGKMLAERLHFTIPIVPGLAYAIWCPNALGGVWDPKGVERYPGEPVKAKTTGIVYYPARPPAMRSSYRYPSGILGSRGGRIYVYRAEEGGAYS